MPVRSADSHLLPAATSTNRLSCGSLDASESTQAERRHEPTAHATGQSNTNPFIFNLKKNHAATLFCYSQSVFLFCVYLFTITPLYVCTAAQKVCESSFVFVILADQMLTQQLHTGSNSEVTTYVCVTAPAFLSSNRSFKNCVKTK